MGCILQNLWDGCCKSTANLCSKAYPLYSVCVPFHFPLNKEYVMCIDTCTLHTHADLFVCIYIYIYIYVHRKRETYKLLTAAYSCNSFCLMALLGFLIVMTNWLPSNAEMGKASWSCRRNMRTYLTMCKGTQGLFSGFFCLFLGCCFFVCLIFLGGKQKRRLDVKRCKSFGIFFAAEVILCECCARRALGLIAVSSEEFLRNPVVPSVKQIAGCSLIPRSPAAHIRLPIAMFGTNQCCRRCS